MCHRGAKVAALSLTYDDALGSHLAVAAPALRAHALRATFFLTDVRSEAAPWSELRKDGHELAFHTFHHPCPAENSWVVPGNASEDYDLARMATELDEGAVMLAALGQPKPYTFAYPCGLDWLGKGHDSYVPLVSERFAAARTASSGVVTESVDLAHVPSSFPTGDGAELVRLVKSAEARGAWLVLGFHGVGGDYTPVSAEAHEALLSYLAEHRDVAMVAPFGEVAACFAPRAAEPNHP